MKPSRQSCPAAEAGLGLFPRAIVCDLADLVAKGRQFPTIYADPPWEYRNLSSRGAATNHYPTLTRDEICSLPIGHLAAADAHLHLWATTPLLEDALRVMQAWGFQYKSCFVWVKEQLGMGNYWRVSHELLLLGVRGNLRFRDRRAKSWILSRRTIHSRKPEAIRLLIERVSPGPYLELFGRVEIPVAGGRSSAIRWRGGCSDLEMRPSAQASPPPTAMRRIPDAQRPEAAARRTPVPTCVRGDAGRASG